MADFQDKHVLLNSLSTLCKPYGKPNDIPEGEEVVDLSGQVMKKAKKDPRTFKTKLLEGGFGQSTKSLDLSNTGIGEEEIRAVLRILQELKQLKKKILLEKLVLEENNFPKKEHERIRQLVGEIYSLMSKGKKKKGNGIFFLKGNKGIKDKSRKTRKASKLQKQDRKWLNAMSLQQEAVVSQELIATSLEDRIERTPREQLSALMYYEKDLNRCSRRKTGRGAGKRPATSQKGLCDRSDVDTFSDASRTKKGGCFW